MDGFEKLFLVSNLLNTEDKNKFIHGFISGFISCVILLTFIMTCYNTYNNLQTRASPFTRINYTPYNYVISDMERYINYY